MRASFVTVGLLLSACLSPVGAPDASGPEGTADAGPGDAGQSVDAGQNLDAGPPSDAGAGFDAGTVWFGIATPSCDPVDRPDWRFSLLDQVCGASSGEGIFIDLFTQDLRLGAYQLPDAGAVCNCGIVANQAVTGVVTLDALFDAGLLGRIDATFMDGSEMHDFLELRFCPRVNPCK
jgi:hypothetical protein